MPLWPMNEDDLEAMEIERLDQQRPEEEQQFERELLEQQDIEGELEDQDILAQLHQESLAADPKYLLYLKARQEEYDQFEAEQEAAEQVFRTGIPSVPYKPIPLVDSTLVAPQPQGFASNKDSKGLAPQQQTADPQQGAEKKVPPKSRKPHNKADDKITPYDVAQKLISHEHFVAIKEDLYWFSGRVYWRLSKTDTLRLIVERCRVVVKEVGNANFVEQVYKCLLQEPSICNSDLLPSPDEVVFLDGVLNLKTRAFFPHTPKVFATSFLTANYEQGKRASCPRFDTFVTEIANGDPLLAQRIWEALGYLLTQDHRGKTFILLQGPTETGKSVFGNFVRSCINKEAVSALDLHSFGGRFDLADLIGKQLCIDMDLSSRRIDERTGSNLKK